MTFVDTGGWISVAVEEDQYHEIGLLHYEELLNRRQPLLTSDYVLDESVTRIRYDAGHATAVAFLDRIWRAERAGSLRVLQVDRTIWHAAEAIFRRYHDQDFSFTDCTSFFLASRARVDDIFGFDHHFLLFGFNVRPLW